ncbi:hypothetical protein HU200_013207 [Digitaria exilis]|uniref:Metallothionein-like protein n=1 Tax=Digitaria exilis TaxID=1010633 RepID=A0A835FEB1_9POAL|nr:hypothetical protein HU200_013207 [Digitaria exilis]
MYPDLEEKSSAGAQSSTVVLGVAPERKQAQFEAATESGEENGCNKNSKHPELEDRSSAVVLGVAPERKLEAAAESGENGCKCGPDCKCDPCTC